MVAFLEYGGDREYYLASAADRVFLLPTSPLDLTGVASYEIFLRGALDKIGAFPDFVHIGDYKTAANQLTEKGFTPAHREMTESLNRDMYDQLVRGIAEGRKKTEAGSARADRPGAVRARGGAAGRAGRRPGLRGPARRAWTDAWPRRRDAIASRAPIPADQRRPRWDSARARASRCSTPWARSCPGKSSYDPVNGSVLGSDTMVEQIRDARDDDTIKAIVLRIDSPGGSSVASDVIWRELMVTREAEHRHGRSSCRCRTSPPRAATTSRCRRTRSWRSRPR